MSHELLAPNKPKVEEDEFETPDFQDLDEEFQAVLKQIGGEQQLKDFHREYEKLYRALKNSHENEKKLIKKCKELNNSITESTIKVQHALRISKEENDKIRAFEADLDRAVKALEAFKDKEDKSKTMIQSLREQIENLGEIVEEGQGLAVGEDSTVNELIRAKEELTKEVEIANEHISAAREEEEFLKEKLQSFESEIEGNEEDIENCNFEITEMKDIMNKEAKMKQDIEIELNEEKSKFEEISEAILGKEQEIQDVVNQRNEVLKLINWEIDEKQEKRTGLDQATKQKQICEEERNEKEKLRETIGREIKKVNREVENTRNAFALLKEEQSRFSNDLKQLTKRNTKLTQERKEAEQIKNQAKEYMQTLIRESDQLRKNTENDRSLIDNLKRERDMIMKNILRAKENIRIQEDTGITMENNKKKLENELKKYSKDIKKLKDKVWQLQKEQERYGIEKSQAYAKYSQCLEEVKLCNSVIAELQKKNAEVEIKLKQQQSLCEAVTSDKNLYAKNLLESHEEIEELDNKKKIMIHQINQLKEEIEDKDIELIQENKRLGDLEKKKKDAESDKEKLESKQEELEQVIKESEREIQRLKYVITEVEQEKLKQKKELELVTNERNILSTQLIHRKSELDLLYEKIKILTSTLKKGEKQYKKRLGDISILKTDIAMLKQRLNATKKEAMAVFDLNKERYYLEKEVLDEKVKVKALSEEVENTMNVHRWRKLEGTDPEAYELITKIETLEKRLIEKTEEVVEKNEVLEEMEKEYDELKITLSRHPGPESEEKIEECKRILEEKNAEMANMKEELGLYQAQANEYKYEIERLTRELEEVKKNYFTIKKKEQLVRDREAKESGKPIILRNPPPQRFTGGGFNLAI